MKQKFNTEEFLSRVGRRLVAEFDDAKQAGTPGLIGAAREHPARKSLERLLPGAAAIGSGLIIDSYEGLSRQQDIVVYEDAWCPVFSINDTPEATYFPCEGVIAVGEVKSGMGSKELEDAFEKISSVKRLRRHAHPSKSELNGADTVCFRKYGVALSVQGVKEEEFDQINKATDQIFGFVLCNEFTLKKDALLRQVTDFWRQYPRDQSPNIIVSLKDGFLSPFDSQKNEFTSSATNADAIVHSPEPERSMGRLVGQLNKMVRNGRTVEVIHFNRYFSSANSSFKLSGGEKL
jgi:hypothetical protein